MTPSRISWAMRRYRVRYLSRLSMMKSKTCADQLAFAEALTLRRWMMVSQVPTSAATDF